MEKPYHTPRGECISNCRRVGCPEPDYKETFKNEAEKDLEAVAMKEASELK